MNHVKIEKYHKQWPEFFRWESENITHALFDDIPDNALEKKFFRIHHIGSTAIPNLSAKPIIDILLECDDIFKIQHIEKKLSVLGYAPIVRNIIPNYTFYTKRYDDTLKISFHLHLMERGEPQIKRHIHFRDYLIHHPQLALEYENLKIELAKKFEMDRYAYTSAKSAFIKNIDCKAKIWDKRQKQFLPPNTDFEIEKMTESQILHAIESNIIVHITHFEQYLPMVLFKREPRCTSVVNECLNDVNFNYILDADFDKEQSDQIISEITKTFTEKQLSFAWWVFPSSNKKMSEYLKKSGFLNINRNIGMYFDIRSWKEEIPQFKNFVIKRANDKSTLKDFSFVLGNNSHFLDSYFEEIATLLTEEDPQEYYVGYLNDNPITCGLICFYGRVAGLHCLTTSPRFRKQGYGTAMQKFRLQRAKYLGYKTAVLQASDSGYVLYLKLGWNPLGIFKEFKKI